MFGLRNSLLCPAVAFCILLGVSNSISESVCVLSDAPNQCGAFCMAALHPLYDQCAKSWEQERSLLQMMADSWAEQKEHLNHYQDAWKLLNVLAANLNATASRLESILVSKAEEDPFNSLLSSPGLRSIKCSSYSLESHASIQT